MPSVYPHQDKHRILLVEDTASDVMLIQEAFEDAGVESDIDEVISDGEGAIERLLDPTRPLPSIVLLDLNLPKCSGIDVLKAVKRNDRAKVVPIVVLTTSPRDEDKIDSYMNHANTYIRKSANFDDLVRLVKVTEAYWFQTASIPASIKGMG